MKFTSVFVFLTVAILSLKAPASETMGCDPRLENCWGRDGGSGNGSSAAYPSTSSGFRLNPSGVPTSNSYGGELIYFNSQYDVSLVHGTGRIGAAVSLQNGEENFFGAPSFEVAPEYLQRKQRLQEYRSQNLSLAGAISVYDNRKSDLKHLQLNLGVQAQFNKVLQTVSPGAGLTGIVGPFSLGVSYALNRERINNYEYGLGPDETIQSGAVTYSIGLYLNVLAIDYSLLQVQPEADFMAAIGEINVSLVTASLLLHRWTLTSSLRTELSNRPAYNFVTKSLETVHAKQEIFGGVQFAPIPQVLVGCFYNYYLLHELSLGFTVFF